VGHRLHRGMEYLQICGPARRRSPGEKGDGQRHEVLPDLKMKGRVKRKGTEEGTGETQAQEPTGELHARENKGGQGGGSLQPHLQAMPIEYKFTDPNSKEG